jgi:hypothetical protein
MRVPRLRWSVPLVVGAALLAGCTSAQPQHRQASPTAPVSVVPRDPLLALADTASPRYGQGSSEPVLHRSGQGPAQFSVARPEGAAGVRFYVSCAPDSRFRVSMGTFFAGSCSTEFQNSGQIPIGPAGQTLEVTLDVPRGVHYWIVGLAVS